MQHIPLAGGNNILGQGGQGWVNSYPGLIMPAAITGFAIFLMKQFYLSLPSELQYAARIDGCSEFGIYLRIIIPLSKPALAPLVFLLFVQPGMSFYGP